MYSVNEQSSSRAKYQAQSEHRAECEHRALSLRPWEFLCALGFCCLNEQASLDVGKHTEVIDYGIRCFVDASIISCQKTNILVRSEKADLHVLFAQSAAKEREWR